MLRPGDPNEVRSVQECYKIMFWTSWQPNLREKKKGQASRGLSLARSSSASKRDQAKRHELLIPAWQEAYPSLLRSP